ncbi:MAG: PilZ domain-containing protein [bacterium]|nr:PilZ domain-containing protein [bacterium]
MNTDEPKEDDKPLEETSSASRRKNLRTPILITKVKVDQNGKVFFGYAKNISRTGLFIQSINPKDEGECFKIEFDLPGDNETFSCMAKVIWKRNYLPKAKYEPGMGLEFIDLPMELTDKLEAWCDLR